jgi:cell division FtsZ-interacting protein ZapD
LVLYEYPFNEGIRTMLRLEHLFDRLGQLVPRDAPVDHHFALATIFEIMDVASRADLKSDLLKELERHRTPADGLPRQPGHRRSRAGRVIGRIDRAFAGLNQLQGKAGPGAGRQRLADEHPQPHQHPRRHLRVRPAGLLRLAAARRPSGAAPTCRAGPAR